MATEIATAYLSIVPETSKIAPGVRTALGAAQRDADSAGRSMGDRMSGALGGALKAGAAAAGATAAAAIGTTMVKGFQRLDAIDQAKGKLSGLGHTAASTGKIMDSALASVKGTAYGLGDAATIAASAVAAGVKPGQDLTKYLSMTADAAAIAGTSLGDMGLILNQVQTGQQAYTDDLNQLADRGIPIYQWLGQEMGVAASEVKGLAAEGKVSSEVLFAAIQKNIGGAAKESGKTVRGAFDNMLAAMGRLGAAVEGPTFARLPAFFSEVTARIDEVTPAAQSMAEAFDAKVFDEWGPKIREALEAFRESDMVRDAQNVFTGLSSAVVDLAPSIGRIVTELGRASAAIGVSGWQLFLTALEAGTAALDVLNPLLSTTAGLMENNRGVVTGLVAAWLAFKTIPALMGRVTGTLAPMATQARTATTSMMGLATANRAVVQAGSFGRVEMGRFGSAIARVGESAPIISRMQSSFVTAAAGANTFGRTAGTAAAAGTGLRAAGAGVASLFGGPLGLALAGAGVAATVVASQMSEAKTQTQQYETATRNLVESQQALNAELFKSRGAVNEDVLGAQTDVLGKFSDQLNAAEDRHQSMWETVTSLNWGTAEQAQANIAATEATETKRALGELGMSHEELSKAITGSGAGYAELRTKLLGMGQDGRTAARDINELRARFLQQQDVARRVAPGVSELGEAMQKLGDKSSSAADKTKALKDALDALNPARSKGEAIAKHDEVMRKVAESTRQAVDQTQGFGQALLDNELGVSTSTANGAALRDSLLDIVDATQSAAASGADMTERNRLNQEALQSLATQYGLSAEEIRAAADKLGLDDVEVVVALKGAPEVVQQLASISQAWGNTPTSKTLEVKESSVNSATRASLERFGIEVSKPMNGMVTLTANDDQARAKILLLTQNVSMLNALKANPTLDINKLQFDAKNSDAHAALAGLDRTQVSPAAGLVIDKLLQGKAVSMSELDALSKTTANPSVNMEIAKIMEKIGIVGTGLDNAARTRTATINVVPQWQSSIESQIGVQAPGRGGFADGGYTGPGSKWQPAGVVHADEFVTKASSRRSLEASRPGALDYMNKTGRWPGYADGGRVLRDLAQGKGASQPLTGAPYVWGGVNWGDCSGAMSAFARAAVGLDPFGGRFSTASEGSYLQQLGFTLGRGSSGDLRFGWFNGGPYGGHTAGTLPDGTNVEMGGNNGGGMLGGSAAGADDPQFTDHAFLKIGPSWTDPGSDTGGFVLRPDGRIVFQPGNGDYSATGGSSTGGGDASSSGSGSSSGDSTSISGLVGNAVSEQVKDALGVFGLNDSPGLLAGYGALKRYDKSDKNSKVTDPGTTKPGDGEDLGKTKDGASSPSAPTPPDTAGSTVAQALASTGNAIKDQFRDGLREAWRQGQPWVDTDWIINKESTWNPKARNGKYFGLGQYSPEVWAAAGKTPTDDPRIQGEVFDNYVGGRYQDPTKARAHHEANNWYDEGGIAPHKGVLMKNINTPERVLSPRQTTAFEQMVRSNFQSGVGTDAIIARLDRLIDAVYAMEGGGDQVTVRDEREYYQRKERRQRARIAAASGGRG